MLVDVTARAPQTTEEMQLESFSLLLRGPTDPELDQGTHELIHDTLGELAIFLTPVVHEDTSARYYEAVFNRIVR